VYAPLRKIRVRDAAGFGMIELLCALTVMSAGVLAVFAMLESGAVQIKRASNISTAAALADTEMEKFRAIKFNAIGLNDTNVAAADSMYTSDAAFRTDTPSTTLTASLTTTSTTMTVTSGSGFPTSAPFRVKIDDEIVLVTAGAGTTSWTITRAADYTAAATHTNGATVTSKQRAHLPTCGTAPCTAHLPTATATGADGKSYRVDKFITWSAITNQSGTTGRNVKLVTIVVRDGTTPSKVYARVSSSFDESTGL